MPSTSFPDPSPLLFSPQTLHLYQTHVLFFSSLLIQNSSVRYYSSSPLLYLLVPPQPLPLYMSHSLGICPSHFPQTPHSDILPLSLFSPHIPPLSPSLFSSTHPRQPQASPLGLVPSTVSRKKALIMKRSNEDESRVCSGGRATTGHYPPPSDRDTKGGALLHPSLAHTTKAAPRPCPAPARPPLRLESGS